LPVELPDDPTLAAIGAGRAFAAERGGPATTTHATPPTCRSGASTRRRTGSRAGCRSGCAPGPATCRGTCASGSARPRTSRRSSRAPARCGGRRRISTARSRPPASRCAA